MGLRFGVFDHIEPVPGQRLDRIYRERLIQIERLDQAGFYAYHLAEHHTPAIHSLEIGVGRGGVMEAFFWGQEADPYPPLWYMRNPVTAAMEGMHTIIVGSLELFTTEVMPRYV
jgi:hypothetical protein